MPRGHQSVGRRDELEQSSSGGDGGGALLFPSTALLFLLLGLPFEPRVESSSILGKMKGWEPVEGRRGNLVRRCQVSGWLGI